MAGIEKICEYSGEYPGWEMYTYKRNLIQVMPKYRKLFKGQEHTLFISEEVELNEKIGRYGYMKLLPLDGRTIKHNNAYFRWYWKDTYSTNGRWKHISIKKTYEYCLYVPNLLGHVKGYYYNSGKSIGSIKRRLKRLLGTKKLNIVYIENNTLLYGLREEEDEQ